MNMRTSATKSFALAVCAGLAAGGSMLTAATPAEAKVVAGTLTCRGKGTVGLILGSKERLICEYAPAGGGERYVYGGRITKVGLDVGFTTGSVMVWTVLGAARTLRPGEMAGRYVGASAEATVALGVGANALVGGNRRSIVLQPLSVQGQKGLNIAIGVSALTLMR